MKLEMDGLLLLKEFDDLVGLYITANHPPVLEYDRGGPRYAELFGKCYVLIYDIRFTRRVRNWFIGKCVFEHIERLLTPDTF